MAIERPARMLLAEISKRILNRPRFIVEDDAFGEGEPRCQRGSSGEIFSIVPVVKWLDPRCFVARAYVYLDMISFTPVHSGEGGSSW